MSDEFDGHSTLANMTWPITMKSSPTSFPTHTNMAEMFSALGSPVHLDYYIYSRTSMARTLIAGLPQIFQTRS